MRFSTLSIATTSVALTSAQTPAESWPITSRNVGCAFGGITVTPGKWISPSDVTTQPSIYRTTPLPSTNKAYMLLMLDLSISSSDVTTPSQYSTLVPGLAPNTTTRLHWWQGNYTIASPQNQNALFLNTSDSIAAYTAQRPRDATNHTYAFYLFTQPDNYFPGEEAANGTYYDETTEARFNFSLKGVVEKVGEPVAANWFVSSA
ncbi:hypothetical protein BPAE_0087g00020 [Botrytis paeoniae]|uniref:Phosphatidylethanolamine-binding protein n=1 Tax=Botrytis paeoniae TaxID=278948 RepID=A0A4Z1FKW0_9HELO|nr:hypothetical protein BPAE_0087g00020 [Botrytis paeoniae]